MELYRSSDQRNQGRWNWLKSLVVGNALAFGGFEPLQRDDLGNDRVAVQALTLQKQEVSAVL